jgi:hypothetical protein
LTGATAERARSAVAIQSALIGHDLNVSVTNLYASPAYGRRDYSAETEDLFEFYTRLFVGRESELSDLAGLASQDAGGYTLVESPPAFGKSAVLAQAIQQLRTGTADSDVTTRVIYFFVRQQGQRNSATEFLSVMNAQLLTVFGLDGGVPPELGALRAQFTELWLHACVTSDRRHPLFLFVDGLDEAAQEQVSIPQLLPGTIRPWVQMIVSCRIDPAATSLVPLEHPLQHPARTITLNSLTEKEVPVLLEQAGAHDLATGTVPSRILRITRGEPLMTRFVCEEVASDGLNALTKLEKEPPKGAQAYFAQQIDQLRASAQYPLTRDILSVLLAALSGMTVGEIADVLKASPWDVEQAIRPVRRFLIGHERLELMHAYFRRELERQFSIREQKQRAALLVEWCATYETEGWPEDTPHYVLSTYVAHLRKSNNSAHIYRLINPAWMKRRWTQTRSYSGYLDDVFNAMEAAISEEPPNLFQQIRAASLVGELVSGLEDAHPAALSALVRLNQVESAVSYATLIRDSGKRVTALLRIANACREGNVDPYWAARPLADMAPGEKSGFWGIALRLRKDLHAVVPMRVRVDQLSQLALLLASVHSPELALRIAESSYAGIEHIEQVRSAAAALVGVASAFAAASGQNRLEEISRKMLEASAGLPLLEQNTLRMAMGTVLTRAGLQSLAAVLVEPVDRAATIDELKASNWQCDVSFDLVGSYLALRKPEDALATANASPHVLDRAGNLAQIALDYRNQGKIDGQLEKQLMGEIGAWMERTEGLQNNKDSAREKEFSSGHSSYTRLIVLPHTLVLEEQIVRYLVAAGAVERLQRFIGKCDRPMQRRLLAVLSESLSMTGKPSETESFALRSLELTRDVDLDRATDEFRMNAGSHLAQLGSIDSASNMVRFMRNRGRKRIVDAALAVEWEKRGELAEAAMLCDSAIADLPRGKEDPIVVSNVIGVLLRMNKYESALQLAESIQSWNVRVLALALVADPCLRNELPEGRAALESMYVTLHSATAEDNMSVDTLMAVVRASLASGRTEEQVTNYVAQVAESVSQAKDSVPTRWLSATLLCNLAVLLDSAALKERARAVILERVRILDSKPDDPWRMVEYGWAARFLENAGLQAEAEAAARVCLVAFKEGVAKWYSSH